MAADAGQTQVGPDVCIHRVPVAHDMAAEGAKVFGRLVTSYCEATKDVRGEEGGEHLGDL